MSRAPDRVVETPAPAAGATGAAFPMARLSDPISHDMLVPSGLIGPPMSGPSMPTVLVEGLPAAHMACSAVCTGAISAPPGIAHPPIPGPPPPVVGPGAVTVLVNNMPALRWNPMPDMGSCGCFLGDAKLMATRTVLIGAAAAPASPTAFPELGEPPQLTRNRLMLQGSDYGRTALAHYESRGVEAKVGAPGTGCFHDPAAGVLTIDPTQEPAQSALGMVRELRRLELQTRAAEIAATASEPLAPAEQVALQIAQEGDALAYQSEARAQLERAGFAAPEPDALDQELARTRDRAREELLARHSDASPEQLDAAAQQAAAERAAEALERGEVEAPGGESYPDYYRRQLAAPTPQAAGARPEELAARIESADPHTAEILRRPNVQAVPLGPEPFAEGSLSRVELTGTGRPVHLTVGGAGSEARILSGSSEGFREIAAQGRARLDDAMARRSLLEAALDATPRADQRFRRLEDAAALRPRPGLEPDAQAAFERILEQHGPSLGPLEQLPGDPARSRVCAVSGADLVEIELELRPDGHIVRSERVLARDLPLPVVR